MTGRKATRQIVPALALVFAAVLVAGGVFWSTKDSESETAERVNSPLITGDRDRVAVCVEDLREKANDSDREELFEQAIAAVEKRPEWPRANLDGVGTSVSFGCRATPYLLSEGIRFENGGFVEMDNFGATDKPSQFRVMVFILDDEQIDRMFTDSPLRTATQESVCSDGVCAEVTSGLYLKASETEDPALLEQRLAEAIGLVKPNVPEIPEPETSDTLPAGP